MGVIIKNTIKTTFINYIGVAIGMVSVLFIQTKVLSEDEIGIIRLIQDKALLVLPFFMLGMHSVASRFFFHFEDNIKTYGGFFTMLFSFPLIVISIGLILIYFFNSYLSIPHLGLIVIVLICHLYITIIESYLHTKSKVAYPSFIRNVLFRIFFLINLALYFFNIITFQELLYFYTAQYIIHFLLIILYCKNFLTFKIRPNLSFLKMPIFKEIIIYALFLLLGVGSAILVTKLDTIMIEGITKSQAFVGIYTVAMSMATIIEVPRRPIVKLSLPILAKKLKENKLDEVDDMYKKSSINLLIIGSILFALMWLNIDLIFQLIPNGETYAQGKYVVFFIGLAKLIDLAVGINNEVLQSSKHYKWNLILMPFLAIISISLNVYFISRFQFVGAAIATFISILVFNAMRTILVYLKLGLNPFFLNYFKVIPFILLPFLLSYFLKLENLYFNAVLTSFFVAVFFILPLYKMKLSEEFNNLLITGIKKIIK